MNLQEAEERARNIATGSRQYSVTGFLGIIVQYFILKKLYGILQKYLAWLNFETDEERAHNIDTGSRQYSVTGFFGTIVQYFTMKKLYSIVKNIQHN